MSHIAPASTRERTGMILVLLNAFVWGLFPVLAADLTSRTDPIFTAGVSAIASGAPFMIFLMATGRVKGLLHPKVRLRLATVAIAGTVFSSLCFFLGAAASTGLNAALLLQVEPLYSLVLAALFLKERVTLPQLLATFLLLIGAIAVMWQDGFAFHQADLLILAAPFWYQVGHLIAKKLYTDVEHPYCIPAVRMVLGGSILLAIALIRKPELTSLLWDLSVMGPILLFGLVIMGLEKLLWYEALHRIDLAKATALLVPSVAVGVLGAWAILGQTPRESQWVGFGFMSVGLVWLAWQGLRAKSPLLVPPVGP